MAEKASHIAARALMPVFRSMQRQAQESIDAVIAEMRNVLRVRYDAGAARLPQGLPAPRLQLRWENGDERYEWACSYELVLPLREFDIRNDAKTGHAVIELGRTRVGGSGAPPWRHSEPRSCTPYRDGAHALWDSAVLGGLPVYVVAPDGGTKLVPAEENDRG